MRKIGLMTFHQSINYGVFLQAYALQEVVKKLGYDPEIIDYNTFVEKKSKKGILYRLKKFDETIDSIKLLIFRSSKESKDRIKKFGEFSKQRFSLTNRITQYKDLKALDNEYYKFICGSDQIWNPNYTKNNPAYYLGFAKENKRIAYAPSFGISDIGVIDSSLKEMISDWIGLIKYLSVREKSGQSIVSCLTGRSSKIVVDPTLLMTKDDWLKIQKKPEGFEKKGYILFYTLGNDVRYNTIARHFARNGKEIIVIPTNPSFTKGKTIQFVYAGVEEFLYLINNSSAVITDSFHGTVFSTIFRKNFYAIKREDTKFSLSSRLEDFLTEIGLSSRCISVNECIEKNGIDSVDYTLSQSKLEKWIEKSYDFLKTALL